jgi:hypothetical protein
MREGERRREEERRRVDVPRPCLFGVDGLHNTSNR